MDDLGVDDEFEFEDMVESNGQWILADVGRRVQAVKPEGGYRFDGMVGELSSFAA